ncbi:MAG: maleylpyruvate isomerase N-terminal domain-containing protein, partial [Ilumatobacteraceae bacterium]
MTDLERDLQGVRTAQAVLIERLTGLTDAQARQPSLLPDWSVGHVLTHIARNADGFRGMVEAAGRGESAPMYPGGMAQRNGDIDAGAGRSATELVADVTTSDAALESAWDALDDDAWQRGAGVAVTGPIPMRDVPGRRWREVAVHHADLGLGYAWSDWPS